MVRSATPEPAGSDSSLGDLVSLAARDISQLIRYEIDLAKTELRGDMRRVGMAGVLFGIAAFFGCLILLSLCFAYAYGLNAIGAPGGLWGAFLFVALTLALLALLATTVASRKMRRLSGMKKTRESVTEGFGMLRRDGKEGKEGKEGRDSKAAITDKGAAQDGRRLEGGPVQDGQRQRPEIAGRNQR